MEALVAFRVVQGLGYNDFFTYQVLDLGGDRQLLLVSVEAEGTVAMNGAFLRDARLVEERQAWTTKELSAPERPKAKAFGDYLKALGDRDSWWFMFFYSVTFGGFIGLASALPGYFNDQYGLSPVTAGYYTAACVFGGSLMRPLGGALADRFGGIRTLLGMYTVAAVCIAAVGFNLPSSYAALALFVCTMLGLGAGNGAVFQLVPQRFRREIGVMTGLIGMAGGIGGFALAAGMGAIKQSTGSYQLALWVFASLGVLAWFGLHGVKRRWRTTWGSAAVTAARV